MHTQNQTSLLTHAFSCTSHVVGYIKKLCMCNFVKSLMNTSHTIEREELMQDIVALMRCHFPLFGYISRTIVSSLIFGID